MGNEHHVVIVGGGFAGLNAAMALRGAPVRVTLIDRRNFHLFQPLLYQVATGGLSPANIAVPLRHVLKRRRYVQVCLAEVIDVDPERKRVILSDGEVPYETLVLCPGAQTSYFGNTDWEPHAPGLKTLEDATEIRRRIFLAFEAAERASGSADIDALRTFAVIGAGPTGVELAGALCEIANHTLRHEFRHIRPEKAKVILLDYAPRVLPTYPEELSAKAQAALERLGVTVRTAVRVDEVRQGEVALTNKDGEKETLRAETIIWAAGVTASPLAQVLARRLNLKLERGGRFPVEPGLTAPGHPEIFVIGDMACCPGPDGNPLPGIAPVAMQQGAHVAKAIRRRLAGKPVEPFRYRDYGNMATIGRSAAVAEIGRLRVAGFTAWVLWLFVHLMKLVQFTNRLLVFIQWAWYYFTWNRSARLITGENPLPFHWRKE